MAGTMKNFLVAIAFCCFCLPVRADPVTDDVRCYIVALQMISSQNSNTQMAAFMAHGYWLGRLDGRAPDMDIEAQVIAEIPNMTKPEFFQAEAARCGQVMIARGQAETKMGEDMKKRGLKAMQEENAR